jgi:putative sporulation protein YtaF
LAVYLPLLVLSLAVSLDGFGAGMMYGMRKIRIPWSSIAIVALCSGIVLFASMAVGSLFVGILSVRAAKMIGAVILIGIGVWAVFQMLAASSGDRGIAEATESAEGDEICSTAHGSGTQEETIVLWEIKRLGLIIKILKTPSVADIDRSGAISASEAVLLGIALSLDSVGAGIGAALIGFNPLATAVTIAVACGVFIAMGAKVGYAFSGFRWISKFSILPGCLLIVMGLYKLL